MKEGSAGKSQWLSLLKDSSVNITWSVLGSWILSWVQRTQSHCAIREILIILASIFCDQILKCFLLLFAKQYKHCSASIWAWMCRSLREDYVFLKTQKPLYLWTGWPSGLPEQALYRKWRLRCTKRLRNNQQNLFQFLVQLLQEKQEEGFYRHKHIYWSIRLVIIG